MFKDEISTMSNVAANKVKFLNNRPGAFFIASMLAGIFIGVGVLLAFTVGGLLSAGDSPATKTLMGVSFGVALSLVVMAGAELFTGNNLVMAVGAHQKTITCKDAAKLWCHCWIGNLVGSVLLAVLFVGSGLYSGAVGEFMAKAAATKMSMPFLDLFLRAILCNMLVCLAVWCATKLKSEVAKLIMIFWCLFAFITTGFEHSIANMTLLSISLFDPMGNLAINFGGWIYNLLVVTFGNMIGGIVLVALPYATIAGKNAAKK